MLKFQETNYFKGICIFLALAIFNLSCQSSYQTNDCDPLPLPIQYDDPQAFKDQVHFALDVVTTMQRLDNYQSVNEVYAGLFEENEHVTELASHMTSEYEESESLGLSNYLDSKVNAELLSANLVVELKKLIVDIENFTIQDQSIESYLDFLESKKDNALLCSSDSQFFNGYIDLAIAIVSYFYPVGSDALAKTNIDGFRGCSWLQAIVCLTFAVLVWVISILDGSNLVQWLIFKAAKVIFNGVELNDTQKSDFGAVLTLIGAFVVAFYAYDYCCPGDGIPEQECHEPTGGLLYSTGCEDHRYVVVGPSEYASTQWENINTIQSSVTTIRAELNFNVQTFGNPSIFVAIVSCIANENEIELFDWNDELIVDYTPLPVNLAWAYTPPSTAQLYSKYEIATTQGSTENLQLSWSVTPQGGAVSSTGSYSGTLTFFTTGTKIVKATLTDICTGESKSVTKSVNVIN